MRRFRFKTEKEFKRDKLWHINTPRGWVENGKMNSYLGQEITDTRNLHACVKKMGFCNTSWSFGNDNYIEILPELYPIY